MNTDTTQRREEHWKRTKALMIKHLVVWFFFAYLVHLFASSLNSINFFGWPLGFYMAAQGSLIAFVVQLFLFAKQQDRIDQDCGVAEES
ncbi:DUF4212 domain-containing protein [Limibacillus halophilus]|uniref:Putative solute:sodium symporter small subunit n=1 Tax=Limibacillus halophilus TaxID=1579333 RepID=A0A839SSC1_9PROT|nr:DUF4212 domain-containing protein [Limibacillus halophilus]MBB3064879.1 putative solute:sodium symporter small subunit [Limibacillus halophilus]